MWLHFKKVGSHPSHNVTRCTYGNLDFPDLKFALPLVDHFSSTFTTMWSTAREVAAGDVVIIWLVSYSFDSSEPC